MASNKDRDCFYRCQKCIYAISDQNTNDYEIKGSRIYFSTIEIPYIIINWDTMNKLNDLEYEWHEILGWKSLKSVSKTKSERESYKRLINIRNKKDIRPMNIAQEKINNADKWNELYENLVKDKDQEFRQSLYQLIVNSRLNPKNPKNLKYIYQMYRERMTKEQYKQEKYLLSIGAKNYTEDYREKLYKQLIKIVSE